MNSPQAGAHGSVVSESRVRVRYAETDQMGVVYHANHFVWFEIGRVELMSRSKGKRNLNITRERLWM